MYIVYSISYEDYKLTVYDVFYDKLDAERDLYNTVINFMIEEEGKNRAKIHRLDVKDINKTWVEIKDGYFANQPKGEDKITLYKKTIINHKGYIYNDIETIISKDRFYGIEKTVEKSELDDGISLTDSDSDTEIMEEDIKHRYDEVIDELKLKFKTDN